MIKNKRKGISLIVLVVTIVVIIILAAAAVVTLTDNNPIKNAQKAKFQNDISAINENIHTYINKKQNETNGIFEKNSLYAFSTEIKHNCIDDFEEEKNGNILNIIGSEYEDYKEDLGIEEGDLVYYIKSDNKEKAEWAKEIGIKTNGFLIDQNGTLQCLYDVSSLVGTNGKLTFPERMKSIADGAFNGIKNVKITELVIPYTCERIGKTAFMDTQITKITFQEKDGKGVKFIDDSAFKNCNSLLEVILPSTLTSAGTALFSGCSKLQRVVLSEKMVNIPKYTFQDCVSLKYVEKMDNVIEIMDSAFSGCSSLELLNISEKLTKIASKAFSGCENLTLNVDANNPEYKMMGDTLCNKAGTKIIQIFRGSNITEYSIPEGVLNISDCFSTCKNVEKLIIPKSLATMTISALDPLTKLSNIEVSSENANFSSDESALYNKDKTILIKCLERGTSYTVKDSVLTLDSYCFSGKSNLKTLVLPDGLKSIKNYVFRYCNGLNQIKLGKEVNSITQYSFAQMYRATPNITIDPENPNYTIENNILYNKDKTILIDSFWNISTVTIPEGVITLGTESFREKTNLKSIRVPSTVTTIINSFYGCTNLKEVYIPSSVTSIGSNTFGNCRNITQIEVHYKVDSNGNEIKPKGSPWGCPAGTKVVKWVKDSL